MDAFLPSPAGAPPCWLPTESSISDPAWPALGDPLKKANHILCSLKMLLLIVLAALQHQAEVPKVPGSASQRHSCPCPLELILCEGGRRFAAAAVPSRKAVGCVEGSGPKGSWLQISGFPRYDDSHQRCP